MKETLIPVLILIFLLIVLGFVLMRLYKFAKKRGGNFQHVYFGATQDFLTKDQNNAMEVVINKKAGQKDEEDKTGEEY